MLRNLNLGTTLARVGHAVALANNQTQDGRLVNRRPSFFAIVRPKDLNQVGSFQPGERFTFISGERNDGVWETKNYASADDKIDLTIDQGSGSIRIH